MCATTVRNLTNANLESRRAKLRDKWCIDSGCTAYLCRNASKFVEIADKNIGKLNLASNVTTEIKARGIVIINTRVREKDRRVNIHDTLHVPDLRTNLLSVAKIMNKGFKVTFDKNSTVVIDKLNNVIL